MLLVERVDGLVLVQDRGRPDGWHSGVGCAGAFDRAAHDVGQRLVGNPIDAAGLELTLATLSVVSTASTVLALTGVAADVRIDGRPGPFGVAIALPSDTVLTVRPPDRGCRVYLSVAGGLDVDPVLGSRSTDTLADIGPEQIATGTELPLGAAAGKPAWRGVATAADFDRPIDAAPGPHIDLLADAEVAGVVMSNSNRVGVRIAQRSLARAGGDLASFPVVPGAVQLTPSGELIVLGPDAGVTGGYPVVAVVARAGLDQIAQCKPGTEVSLRIRRPRSAR